jgi:hypothetical protein
MGCPRKTLYGRLIKGIDMKKISSIISLSFLVLILLVSNVNSSSDWLKFYTGKMGNVTSYKKVTTENGQEKYVVKEVFSDTGRKEYIQDRMGKKLSIEGYDKLSNIQSLSEIDCNKRMIMNISVYHFDTDGKKLDSYLVDTPKWVKIRNNSFFDILLKEVCK